MLGRPPRAPQHARVSEDASFPTRRRVLRIAWPIILANASSPLLGLADTAVIGHNDSVEALGAIALGALIFNFVYWGFGFLRMATTGFVAQADGARDELEVRTSVVRPLLIGGVIGALLFALQGPIERASLWMLDAGPGVETITAEYLRVRIWGAPATLATFALMGTLIGLGESRRLLAVQLFLNGLNIGLDVLFAGVMGMGAVGVALGTAIAEWTSLVLALVIVMRLLRARHRDAAPFVDWAHLLDRRALRGMFGAHVDIMARTIFLLAGFAWFTNEGARFGDDVLAANHLLLQIVSFSAFFLDGFAFATESLVGRAKGARDLAAFDRALRATTELALVSALGLAALIWLCGGAGVDALTEHQVVRDLAREHLGQVVVYVALSVWAFQLDGLFIGVTRTRAMAVATLVALLLFLGLSELLVPAHANHGLWWAFIGYVVLRAVSLGVVVPSLRRSIAAQA